MTGLNQNSLYGHFDFNPKFLKFLGGEIKDFKGILKFLEVAFDLGDSFYVNPGPFGKFPGRFTARSLEKGLKSDLHHVSLVSDRIFWNYLVNLTKNGPKVVIFRGWIYQFSRSDQWENYDVLVERKSVGGPWWRRYVLTWMGF